MHESRHVSGRNAGPRGMDTERIDRIPPARLRVATVTTGGAEREVTMRVAPPVAFLAVLSLVLAAVPAPAHSRMSAVADTSAGPGWPPRAADIPPLDPPVAAPERPRLAALVPACGSSAVTVAWFSRAAESLSHAEECALRPQDEFRECDLCPQMVVVPAGRFTMGSPATEKDRAKLEGPQHEVAIARAFAVGKFHVTVDQLSAFVAETRHDLGARCATFEGGRVEERPGRSWRNPGFEQTGTHPAVCLSWTDAEAYVDWLSRRTGQPYRLLTEAEWEYAARARTAPGAYPRFWFGDEEQDLCRHGNGADEAVKGKVPGTTTWRFAPCNDGHAYTSPVGSFDANDFGLFDMAGNAWQWTADCWNDSYDGAPSDGSARTNGNCSRRVLRGGSWSYHPGFLRAATRNGDAATVRTGINGLRVARTLTWLP